MPTHYPPMLEATTYGYYGLRAIHLGGFDKIVVLGHHTDTRRVIAAICAQERWLIEQTHPGLHAPWHCWLRAAMNRTGLRVSDMLHRCWAFLEDENVRIWTMHLGIHEGAPITGQRPGAFPVTVFTNGTGQPPVCACTPGHDDRAPMLQVRWESKRATSMSKNELIAHRDELRALCGVDDQGDSCFVNDVFFGYCGTAPQELSGQLGVKRLLHGKTDREIADLVIANTDPS